MKATASFALSGASFGSRLREQRGGPEPSGGWARGGTDDRHTDRVGVRYGCRRVSGIGVEHRKGAVTIRSRCPGIQLFQMPRNFCAFES